MSSKPHFTLKGPWTMWTVEPSLSKRANSMCKQFVMGKTSFSRVAFITSGKVAHKLAIRVCTRFIYIFQIPVFCANPPRSIRIYLRPGLFLFENIPRRWLTFTRNSPRSKPRVLRSTPFPSLCLKRQTAVLMQRRSKARSPSVSKSMTQSPELLEVSNFFPPQYIFYCS